MKIFLALRNQSATIRGMTVKVPTIECPKCEGAGRVALSPELRLVLDYVRRHHGATAPMIVDELDPQGELTRSAWNQRLQMLMEYGYLSRRKSGATYFWTVSKH